MKAQRYQIILNGFIDASWSVYFSGMAMIIDSIGVTRLDGELADQSALHGLFHKIHGLNLKLVSVQLLESDGVTPVECRYCWKNRNILKEENK